MIRGVPLISLLFMASVMFPLFMPDGVNIDKLLRAQIAFVLYAGRLSCRKSHSRRPAGCSQGTARGRRCAGPLVLAEKRLDHSAAGYPSCDPATGEYVHRVLQGYQSGSDHRIFDLLTTAKDRHHRSRLAVVQC